MRRWAVAAGVALAALGPVGGAAAQEVTRLTVEGRGEIARMPDMALVSVGVVERAETAADALAAMSEATEAVLAQIETRGIEPRDVRTGTLTLRPDWGRGEDEPEIVGFVARTDLELRVRRLDGLGALLDALVQGGGANRLDGLRFALAEPRAAEDAARRAAWADAMAKAALYAEAGGLAVGRVVSATELGGGMPPPRLMGMDRAMAAESVPVAEGEVTVSVGLEIEVELVPAD
jgi:uncharacterized protein YggE